MGRSRLGPRLEQRRIHVVSLAQALQGAVHQKNRVLGNQAHQQDHADHRAQRQMLPGEEQPEQRAAQGQRQRDHDGASFGS
jgi:hypothetical protein